MTNKDFEYWKKRVNDHGEKSVRDLNPRLGAYDDELRLKAFSKAVGIKKNMKVLDVGCGTGNFCIWLAKNMCNVTGIDFQAGLISIAKENARKCNLEIDFKEQGAENLDSVNNYYDLITTVTVLQHITDNARLLKTLTNVHGLLNSTGKFVVIEYMPKKISNKVSYSDYMLLKTRAEWLSIFERAGFKLVKEAGVRIIGFKLYKFIKNNMILKLSLLADKLLCSLPWVSVRCSDTRLMVLQKA